MSLGVKNPASGLNHTFSKRCLDHMTFRLMNYLVFSVKKQIQIFCCFSQKEGLHTIFQGVITDIFDSGISAFSFGTIFNAKKKNPIFTESFVSKMSKKSKNFEYSCFFSYVAFFNSISDKNRDFWQENLII